MLAVDASGSREKGSAPTAERTYRPQRPATARPRGEDNAERTPASRCTPLILPRVRNTARGTIPNTVRWERCDTAARSATFPNFVLPLPLELPATSLAALQQHSTVCADGRVVARTDSERQSPKSSDTVLRCCVCSEAVPNHYPTQARAASGCCSARCRWTLRKVTDALA
jgi:hypothetical protein